MWVFPEADLDTITQMQVFTFEVKKKKKKKIKIPPMWVGVGEVKQRSEDS